MERDKKNLRTGKKRIRLHAFAKSKARDDKVARGGAFQERVTVAAKDTAVGIKNRVTPLARPKLQIGGLKIPIVFIAIAILIILPIGMSFADEPADPHDISNQVQIYNVVFHTGTPSAPGVFTSDSYTDGTQIQNSGNYWISFDWKLNYNYGTDGLIGGIKPGDYFYVTLDLGLEKLPAEVTENTGSFSPIIVAPDGVTVAGTINWYNQSSYATDQDVVLRLIFDGTSFQGLDNGGTDDNRVSGSAVWGFQYTAGSQTDGQTHVTWQLSGSDPYPGEYIIVIPQPGVDQPGNYNLNPYEKNEPGYKKTGLRLTSTTTPLPDTIFYWNIMVNMHKHNSLAEWADALKTEEATYGSDVLPDPVPLLNDDGTFTIIDQGQYMAPTWLRNVVETSSGPVIYPDQSIGINKAGGLYGQTATETVGPAYFKLYYVNSAYIWTDRIDKAGSYYKIPANDTLHKGMQGNHPVGPYDPYFSTWALEKGEDDAVLYAPNGLQSGGKYYNYLIPVPQDYIKSIKMTPDGFEINVDVNALFNSGPAGTLGNTLAVAYMTMPSPDDQGYYHANVSNGVSITSKDEGTVTSAEGHVLLGGNVSGLSPNKGTFTIEKRDMNDTSLMPGVVFDVTASSANASLATAANTLIDQQKAASSTGKLVTGQDGRITLTLPPLPWTDNIVLSITETPPQDYVGVGTFTATIDRTSGQATITPATGFNRYVQLAPNKYGSIVWNRYSQIDKSYYDVALRKFITLVNRDIDGQNYEVYFNSNPNTDVPLVKNGDKILYNVVVYNQCFNDVIIPSVSDWLPAGLSFDSGAVMAGHRDPNMTSVPAPFNNSNWELIPGTGGAPDKLEYVGAPIQLPARTNVSDPYPQFTIPLILTVNVPDGTADGTMLTNIARITDLQNGDGEEVEDIDSFIEDDRDKDAGPSPGIDYGDDIPPGYVDDNNIEEHHKTPDGEIDNTQDEDTHDYASVVISNETTIACQVDKDTIRRTSAAYVSPTDDPLQIDNVNQEQYLYNINFRSTSTLPAEEFVVDDPLENVVNDQNHLLALWTPTVWGDQDGRMNVWYKTKNGSGNSGNTAPTGTGPNGAITQVANPRYPTNASDGWKLWQTVVEDPATFASNGGVIERVRLNVEDLHLSSGDYVTALRFEYGAVKVGFTSKNYSSMSLNGEHRNDDGSLNMDPMDYAKVAQPVANKMPELPVPLLTSTDASTSSGGNFFTQLLSSIFGTGTNAYATDTPAYGIGGPTDVVDSVAPGGAVDWTPKPSDPFFALGALNAKGLAPATYLVDCVRAMTTENIVSSAVARIANGALYDEDVDAVITKELVTTLPTEKNDNKYTLSTSFSDNIPKLTPNTETTVGGRSARTYDAMNPLFWIGSAASALAAAGLVFLLWVRRRRRILAAAHARRRHTR